MGEVALLEGLRLNPYASLVSGVRFGLTLPLPSVHFLISKMGMAVSSSGVVERIQ